MFPTSSLIKYFQIMIAFTRIQNHFSNYKKIKKKRKNKTKQKQNPSFIIKVKNTLMKVLMVSNITINSINLYMLSIGAF